jgi:signal transduction histidine kinase
MTDSARRTHEPQAYGSLVPLNTAGTVQQAVDPEVLTDVVDDYLDLLETSAAVYEKNGDYALGIFSSGWCRFMDARSRELCATDSNAEALASGAWHCHESCWKTSRSAIEANAPVDLPCLGGIRIYAVPIRVDGDVVGSINFGYGDPPQAPATLRELAERYQVSEEALLAQARLYESRPPALVELAKQRLHTSAKLLGSMVERREAERRLERLSEELARSNADLEQFAYVASHDLREPLRMISGFVQLLAERYRGQLDADADEFIGYAVDGAQRMQGLIDDLLAYSRIGTGAWTPVDTDATVAFGHAVADLRRVIEDAGAVITHDALPVVVAEPGQLERVLANLLGNALKFRGPAAPRIHVSAERSAEGWVFAVQDNGIGIDSRYFERVFQIFQRLHTKEYPGSGMGLAIARRIVERHGGRVWVESTPGAGSTFFFLIPDGVAAPA